MDDRRGSVTLLVALAGVAIFGFTAVSVDAGRAYLSRQQLVNIADAAVMAGVRELPWSPHAAVVKARENLSANGYNPDRAEVTVLPPGNRLRVVVDADVVFPFGAVIGRSSGMVQATAEAEVVTVGKLRGAQPFGIETAPFNYGQAYVIKLQSTDGVPGPQQGNFHAMALGGTGADVYRQNIMYGHSGSIAAGQTFLTEPGNMVGPTRDGIKYRLDVSPNDTFQNHSARSARVLIIPIVESFNVGGRKELRVLGFGAFFLEGYDGSHIYGRFLKYVYEGEEAPGAADFGITSYRLLRVGLGGPP
ncbi:MAG: Tad domain-containing protein [Bacillota bacterium]